MDKPVAYPADLDELLTDMSWRATRYASNGQYPQHDVMVEAYRLVADTYGRTYHDCDCVDLYTQRQAES